MTCAQFGCLVHGLGHGKLLPGPKESVADSTKTSAVVDVDHEPEIMYTNIMLL